MAREGEDRIRLALGCLYLILIAVFLCTTRNRTWRFAGALGTEWQVMMDRCGMSARVPGSLALLGEHLSARDSVGVFFFCIPMRCLLNLLKASRTQDVPEDARIASYRWVWMCLSVAVFQGSPQRFHFLRCDSVLRRSSNKCSNNLNRTHTHTSGTRRLMR